MDSTLTLGASIVAVTEWVKSLDPTNKITGWVTLPVALLVGALAGYTHFLGTANLQAGLVAGFLAVGSHTLISVMSK